MGCTSWVTRSVVTPALLFVVIPARRAAGEKICVLVIQCEASGFAPHTLDLGWEFTGADGKSRSLGQGGVTGHRQASDGTFSQSTRLELDSGKLGLGCGGDVTCVAKQDGGTRRATATLNVIDRLSVSVFIEDSMAMVAVTLVLYMIVSLLDIQLF